MSNFRVRRALTPLESALDKSGQTLDWFARRLTHRGATKTQLDSARRILRHHLKNGGATENYASRVAHLLSATGSPLHDLLLKPRPCWPRWALTETTRADGEKTVGAYPNQMR